MISFSHRPVMLHETIEGLRVLPNGTYMDCTLGGGGHSAEILRRLQGGKLIAVDKDPEALAYTREKLGAGPVYIHSDFKDVIASGEYVGLDGILMDLGVSSYQLDTPERGFSYRYDAPLDMRMNTEGGMTAENVVNGYSEEALADVMFRYGEESFSRRIARNIVKERASRPIHTTGELVDVIKRSLPAKCSYQYLQSAKRVFQAIRIEVNGELTELYETVLRGIKLLRPGGRIAIITFHSLEDRAVKQAFKYAEASCVCPPKTPICTCGKVSEIEILTKKPIIPSAEEQEENPRSKSAKLRIAEKK